MQIQRFWELESAPETKPLTKEEVLCESIFIKTHSRDSNGKYTVALPLKENTSPLGDSRGIALSRLHRLESKPSGNPALQAEYVQCLQEYLDLGHTMFFYFFGTNLH
ncbi:jg3429 [Pararge aegeria aegeria]|uniref:Jg3429 protein n=1 Tax=Pararge aegeria aegeria TaxID=348720 RepID=A0A8S4RT14_9NEOP|nr:jg3429 [Pararge aegeria aegeria]